MNQPHKATVLHRLDKNLSEISDVQAAGPSDTFRFETWRNDCRATIRYAFPLEVTRQFEFDNIRYFPGVSGVNTTAMFSRGLQQKAQAFLESMKNEVVDLWPAEDGQPTPLPRRPPGNRVFIVHGHATGPKDQTEQFLRSLGLVPVILHQQPNEGRTIIEKFEKYADVSFALVLLTPDDVGGSNATPAEGLKPRARQNVIFELGFFIGKLGRDKVTALVAGDVETPSDYDGVLFVPMDVGGNWRDSVGTELRAAGLPFQA